MISVILVQKTLQRLEIRDLRRLARDNGIKVHSKMTQTELIQGLLLRPWWLWSGGGKETTEAKMAWADLPEAVLEKIFKQLSQAEIRHLRIALPELHKKLKRLEAERKTYLKDVIASRSLVGSPRVIMASEYGPVWSVAWSPDGSRLASGSNDRSIQIWDPVTDEEIKKLTGNLGAVTSVAWSPDGSKLASGSYDETVRIWDPENGKQIGKTLGQKPISNLTDWVTSVAWSPDGSKLASANSDSHRIGGGVFRIWNPNTGEQIKELKDYKSASSVAWSPDGSKLALGSRKLQIWDLKTNKIEEFKGHRNTVTCVAWSSDGSRLVSGSQDWTVRIWDPDTGEEIKKLTHSGTVTSVAWSPDGSKLASASVREDEGIRIWDATTGNQIGELLSYKNDSLKTLLRDTRYTKYEEVLEELGIKNVKDLANMDVSEAKNVPIVTARELKRAARKRVNEFVWMWSVAWSPDGLQLAAAGSDGSIRIWPV